MVLPLKKQLIMGIINVVTDISTDITTQKKGFGEISEALENSE